MIFFGGGSAELDVEVEIQFSYDKKVSGFTGPRPYLVLFSGGPNVAARCNTLDDAINWVHIELYTIEPYTVWPPPDTRGVVQQIYDDTQRTIREASDKQYKEAVSVPKHLEGKLGVCSCHICTRESYVKACSDTGCPLHNLIPQCGYCMKNAGGFAKVLNREELKRVNSISCGCRGFRMCDECKPSI